MIRRRTGDTKAKLIPRHIYDSIQDLIGACNSVVTTCRKQINIKTFYLDGKTSLYSVGGCSCYPADKTEGEETTLPIEYDPQDTLKEFKKALASANARFNNRIPSALKDTQVKTTNSESSTAAKEKKVVSNPYIKSK